MPSARNADTSLCWQRPRRWLGLERAVSKVSAARCRGTGIALVAFSMPSTPETLACIARQPGYTCRPSRRAAGGGRRRPALSSEAVGWRRPAPAAGESAAGTSMGQPTPPRAHGSFSSGACEFRYLRVISCICSIFTVEVDHVIARSCRPGGTSAARAAAARGNAQAGQK